MSKRIAAYEGRGRSRDDEDFEAEGGEPVRRPRRAPEVEVLLDDPRFVVVAKPSGVPTVPERFRREEPTVVDLAHRRLRRGDPAAPRPVVVHRLDKDTSGALVLAKDEAAARDLTAQFEARTVVKSYLALALGAPQPPAGETTFRVDEDPRRPGAMAIVGKGGRECVRVVPITGRTHQVRLTLLHLGAPCAIDPLYGSSVPLYLSQWKRDYRVGREGVETPLLDRLSLHAERLAFRRPGASEGDAAARVTVEAPLPRDFATTLRQLRRWAAAGTL
jgi:23S rRNA-/tRNA-specific pseudouridylate synthase